jgi:hypothetical protein
LPWSAKSSLEFESGGEPADRQDIIGDGGAPDRIDFEMLPNQFVRIAVWRVRAEDRKLQGTAKVSHKLFFFAWSLAGSLTLQPTARIY